MLAVVTLAAAGTGGAVSKVGNFGVSTTLRKLCSVTATALNFGNYIAGACALSVNSTVNVSCTRSTAFSVALNKGTTAGGTISQRLLTHGASTLPYNLFRTPAAATVFGKLPDSASNRAATPGGYTDTVGVTLTY